jgi:hypothetical protein
MDVNFVFPGFRLSSASPHLPPTSSKQQSEIHTISGHASITTMMSSIPIPTILKLTQQSTMLHNRKLGL